MRPPVGAAILGFMAVLAGVVNILQGLRFMGVLLFGRGELGDGLLFFGVFALLVGLAWLAAGYGLWATQAWAWTFAMIIAVFGLVNAVIVLFSTGDLGIGLGVALLPLTVIWYLQQADIKRTFGVDAESRL